MKAKVKEQKRIFSFRAHPTLVKKVRDKLEKKKPRETLSEKISEMLYDYISR
jgi:hypothetical protein